MAGKWSRKVTLGKETTAGTAVPTTVVWAGNGLANEERDMVTLDYDDGSIMGNDDSYTQKVSGVLPLEETEATFEQLPMICEMGIVSVSGSADGSGSGYIYTYPFPELADQTIKTATAESGDTIQAKEMDYVYCEDFTLTGIAGEAMKMAANLRGRQWTPTTATAALTPISVEPILFGKGALYIDTTFGTWGDTVKASTLLGMALNVTTGKKAKYTANGDIEFDFTYQGKCEIMLDITFEYDATAVAMEAGWRAETPYYIELIWTGSAHGTSGTTYSSKTLDLMLYGKWISFESMADLDGNNIMTGTFKGMYDSANTVTGSIVVVPELADVWAGS